jgi:diguanylate cyclase (GGDEF)-like protein
LESTELLKQNLAIESDLQNFIGFALETIKRLGGNAFASSVALLAVMEKLRCAGAATGKPLYVSLNLQEQEVTLQWLGQMAGIGYLKRLPAQDAIDAWKAHLLNSTKAADPDILIQRNAEMTKFLEETRRQTENELRELQRTLEMRQAELQKSLHEAETDPLTKLFNRRAFDQKINQAFRHTMRQKITPLSLLLFDLDYFKNVNDEFGHQFGDAYLNKMASALREVVREDVDFVFRFGGDEFAMLIFADHAQACDKARQVLESMGKKVSIGISTIDKHTPTDFTLEDFIRHADDSLYEAKQRGRGRVVTKPCIESDSSSCQFPCPKMVACA